MKNWFGLSNQEKERKKVQTNSQDQHYFKHQEEVKKEVGIFPSDPVDFGKRNNEDEEDDDEDYDRPQNSLFETGSVEKFTEGSRWGIDVSHLEDLTPYSLSLDEENGVTSNIVILVEPWRLELIKKYLQSQNFTWTIHNNTPFQNFQNNDMIGRTGSMSKKPSFKSGGGDGGAVEKKSSPISTAMKQAFSPVMTSVTSIANFAFSMGGVTEEGGWGRSSSSITIDNEKGGKSIDPSPLSLGKGVAVHQMTKTYVTSFQKPSPKTMRDQYGEEINNDDVNNIYSNTRDHWSIRDYQPYVVIKKSSTSSSSSSSAKKVDVQSINLVQQLRFCEIYSYNFEVWYEALQGLKVTRLPLPKQKSSSLKKSKSSSSTRIIDILSPPSPHLSLPANASTSSTYDPIPECLVERLTEEEILTLTKMSNMDAKELVEGGGDPAVKKSAFSLINRLQKLMDAFENENSSSTQKKNGEEVGYYFVRLGTRSPKDADMRGSSTKKIFLDLTNPNKFREAKDCLMVRNAEEAVMLLAQSQRVKEDLAGYASFNYKNKSLSFVAKRYQPHEVAYEFRCFVFDRKLTAVSQYDCYNQHEYGRDRNFEKSILDAITHFMFQIIDCLPWSAAVVDVYCPPEILDLEARQVPRFSPVIVECKPFGGDLITGSALFHWKFDFDILNGAFIGRQKAKEQETLANSSTFTEPTSHVVFRVLSDDSNTLQWHYV